MDYGQPTQSANIPDSFTAGAGNNNPEINTFESENNLDLTNPESSWGQAPERDPRTIGSKVGKSAEMDLPMPEATSPIETPNIHELGKVFDREQPIVPSPSHQAKTPLEDTKIIEESLSSNIEPIKITEKLNDSGIKFVNDAENKLTADGNAEEYYDSIRGANGGFDQAMEASFGELSNWQPTDVKTPQPKEVAW